jgi:hypothetical protein
MTINKTTFLFKQFGSLGAVNKVNIKMNQTTPKLQSFVRIQNKGLTKYRSKDDSWYTVL